MAKYKAYPEYKESGVEWLGAVPSHWEILSAKRMFQSVRTPAYKSDGQLAASQKYGVIPQSLMMQLNDSKVMLALKGTESFRHVEANNFVISLRSFEGGIEYSQYTGCVSPAYTVLKNSKPISYGYYRYLLKCMPFIAALQSSTDSLRDGKSINYEQFSALSLPLFSVQEQNVIAVFLDHETTKIDNLIEKQQQLIELLKEKRQTVISHAVTKGLNPDVTMKDSCVEWLGEVPEHWEVKRIKHFGKVIGGFAFKSTDFTDEGYPVIKISNVSHLSFDWGDSSFLPPSFSFTHKEYLAPNGALVFAMTRPVISGGIKVTLLDDDSAPLVNQRVGFMMVKSKNMARYILISTQSSAFLAHFVNNMTVTNQPNISSEGIESIYLPVPPMSEISRILLYVDRMNESYNQLIDKALLQVSLLLERRTALISAAVTGKIDVRDWVAPDTQEAEEPQEATA